MVYHSVNCVSLFSFFFKIYMRPCSSVAEHWSLKPGVLNSILSGGSLVRSLFIYCFDELPEFFIFLHLSYMVYFDTFPASVVQCFN